MQLVRLSGDEIMQRMENVEGWKHQNIKPPEMPDEAGMDSLIKMFPFSSYKESREFANKVSDIAEGLAHYPSITFTDKHCSVILWTDYLNGLTEKDFEIAAEIDKIGADYTKF